jgi:hypothetical protein
MIVVLVDWRIALLANGPLLTDTDRPVSYIQNGLYQSTNIPERAVEEKRGKSMLNNSIKSTNVKAGRPVLQSAREATAGRGLQASRGLPADARSASQAAVPSVPADRLGMAVTLLLSLALVAGGSLMVAQIWANLAMIR